MRVRNAVKLILLATLLTILLIPNGTAYSTAPFLITPYFGSFAVSQDYSTEHRTHDYIMRYDPVLAADDGTVREVGARDISMPYLKKNLGGWDASLTIQNVGNVATQVSVYDINGNDVYFPLPYDLQPGYSYEVYSEIPSGFFGSIQIHSDWSEIVAAVHQVHSDGRHFGYSAP